MKTYIQQAIRACSPQKDKRNTSMRAGLAVLMIAALLNACGQSTNDQSTNDQSTTGQSDTVQSDMVQSNTGQASAAPNGDTADTPLALEPRDADAPRAMAEPAENFEFIRYRINTEDAAPAACLVFTRALDPGTDYDPYILVRGALSPALTVEGDALCVGGLAFGNDTTIRLRAGLPSADGQSLADDEDITVSFGDRPAYVSFAGDGVILPRKDADGVAIETINVTELEISVSRVTDRALAFRRIVAGYSAGKDDYGSLYGDETPQGVGTTIWSGKMDVDTIPNAPVTTVFPIAQTIGTLQPGAYVIAVNVPDQSSDRDSYYWRPARAERWFVITDVALTGYRSNAGLTMVARSLDTAKPMPGVRLDLVAQSNEVLASAETGTDGAARFDGPLLAGEEGNAPRMVMAYGPEGDFAVLDLQRSPVDLSAQPIGGRADLNNATAYVYADRGIYRPGEEVFITGLMRDRDAIAIADRAGEVRIVGPNGIVAATSRFTQAPDAGAVRIDYTIPRNAARGQWSAQVDVDGLGVIGTTFFAVEDFVPQRISLDIEGDTETPVRAGGQAVVDADVQFLYGAPGAGLTVQGQGRIERDRYPFGDAYARFRFGIANQAFSSQQITAPDAVADGAGRTQLVFTPGRAGTSANEPLSMRLIVTALEPGGRPVSQDIRFPYRPRDAYIGLTPQDGGIKAKSPLRFDTVLLDADGQRIAGRANWTLVRHDRQYDWYNTGNGWRWRSTENTVAIQSGQTEFSADGAVEIIAQPVDYGHYELTLTHPETGIATSVRFYASYWGYWRRGTSASPDAPDQVEVVGPQTPIAVGDTVEFRITPPFAGEAEIVIANDDVLERRVISVPENGTSVRVTATQDWGLGAYVMASVYTPRDPVSEPRPRRAVGVAYAPIDISNRQYDLTITAPDIARPGQDATITIAANNGPRSGQPSGQPSGDRAEAAYVTMAAVDEGILQLTKFQSPAPTDLFFGKQALSVDVLDDYGRLLDPNQGMAAAVREGGDAADSLGGPGLTVVPTQSVALFQGPLDLDSQGEARINFTMPDFNGRLRLMVVAWSDTGLGQADAPLIVREPVPVNLVLPRFLAPGDETIATVSIDNVEGPAGTYSAIVDSAGPLAVQAGETTLKLDERARGDAPITLIANAGPGIADIALSASGPNDFATTHDYPIQIRSPFLPTATAYRGQLAPGEAYVVPPNILDDFLPGSGEITVAFSPFPLDASAIYDSLSRYPYGCTEQTVSRALPLVYASDAATLAAMQDTKASETRRIIQDAVETILSRQSSNGAIGLWRVGDANATPWIGAYTTDFLYRAKAAGAPVPDAALAKAYDALRPIANGEYYNAYGYDTRRRWDSESAPWWYGDTYERRMARGRTYAVYVLARAGRMDASQLRYIHDERMDPIQSPLAWAHMGAALAHMGDRARATLAFNTAIDRIGHTNRGNYYQTPTRDLAGIIALAAEVGMDEVLTGLLADLQKTSPDPARMTTQEKAFILMALNAVTDGKPIAITAQNAAPLANPSSFSANSFAVGAAGLADGTMFTNDGTTPIFRTIVAMGAPATPPPAVTEGIGVDKSVWTMDGQPADLANVRQGDQLIVRIILNPQTRDRVPAIVADLLPAGFEIDKAIEPYDTTPGEVFSWLGDDMATAKITELRDDRYVAAIDLYGETKALAYMVRAVTPGRYTMPGAVAEDMYRVDRFGRSAPGEVAIASAF